MRILFLDEKFGIPEKGFGLRTYEFGSRLAEKGHSVTVITGNAIMNLSLKDENCRKINIAGMDVLVVNNFSENLSPDREDSVGSADKTGETRNSKFARIAFSEASKLNKPDVIVAVAAPIGNAYAGLKLSKKFKAPLIVDVRKLYSGRNAKNFKNKETFSASRGLFSGLVEKAIYSHATRIITVSPLMLSGVLKHNSDIEKIEYIPHFADLEAFSLGKEACSDKSFLKEYKIKNNFIVVYVGNVDHNAGMEFFLGAAALHSASDISWVVAGNGNALPEMEKQVNDAGLQEQVHFLKNLSKDGMIKLLGCSDCILVLFRNESAYSNGPPEHFFSCLAAGKPMLINMSGWAAELINKYNAGIAVPPGSFREIARNVGSLSSKPDLVRIMGENARILAAEKFDLATISQQFEDVVIKAAKV